MTTKEERKSKALMENIILLKSPKAWPEIFAFEHLKKKIETPGI